MIKTKSLREHSHVNILILFMPMLLNICANSQLVKRQRGEKKTERERERERQRERERERASFFITYLAMDTTSLITDFYFVVTT